MKAIRARELGTLFAGDIAVLYVSLWATLLVRYGHLPQKALLMAHVVPFSMLFAVWILVFFMLGLYDQHTTVFRARLPERILRVQIINVAIAALFFFFIPIFGIAPKTNLIIYLGVSFLAMTMWRLGIFVLVSKRTKQHALLIGGGAELKELLAEVNTNHRYPFHFTKTISADKLEGNTISDKIFSALRDKELAFVVIDTHHRKLANILPHLYKPLFSDVRFINARDLYEEIFERMPLSILGDAPSIEVMMTREESNIYAFTKRVIDIIGGLGMGLVTVIVMPFVWAAMRLEGPGPLLITQERFGHHSKPITVYKFRSMTHNEKASSAWVGENHNKVTRVGSFLRQTSLDEFPQFLNILSGELSLIGPRNDIEGLGKRLAEEIPLYNARYCVKPGITGWAQVNQQYEPGNISPQSIEESKMRLMYDLYYVKNRSLLIDIVIALKTFKRMVFRLSTW